jgi:group I intron endonuclease
MSFMLIYKITNRVNGKVYIGKWQGRRVEDRWKVHLACAAEGSRFHFHRAIRKFGPDAFQVEVLRETDDGIELCLLEKELIAFFQSSNPEFGYNMTLGGDGIPGFSHTEETKRKIGNANRGKVISDVGRDRMSASHMGIPLTSKCRQNMSLTQKRIGNKPPPGSHIVPHSEESKNLISEKTKQGMAFVDKQKLRESSIRASHKRWHTKRGIANPKCSLCLEN